MKESTLRAIIRDELERALSRPVAVPLPADRGEVYHKAVELAAALNADLAARQAQALQQEDGELMLGLLAVLQQALVEVVGSLPNALDWPDANLAQVELARRRVLCLFNRPAAQTLGDAW